MNMLPARIVYPIILARTIQLGGYRLVCSSSPIIPQKDFSLGKQFSLWRAFGIGMAALCVIVVCVLVVAFVVVSVLPET